MKDDINIAKQELIDLFVRFRENPTSESVHNDAIKLEGEYASLTNYDDYFSKEVVPQDLIDAIGFLQRIYQFEDDVFDKRETMKIFKSLFNKLH